VSAQQLDRAGVDHELALLVALRLLLDQGAVGQLGDGRADTHGAGVEVDVVPAQPADLTSSGAGGGQQAEGHAVLLMTAGQGLLDQCSHDLGTRYPPADPARRWRRGQLHRVAWHPIPRHGLTERGQHDGVVALHRAGGETVGLEPDVVVVQGLDADPGDRRPADLVLGDLLGDRPVALDRASLSAPSRWLMWAVSSSSRV